MVRKTILLLTFGAILGLVVNAQIETCGYSNTSFKSGEKMTYDVGYAWGLMWLRAGEVTFSVSDTIIRQKPAYHIVGEGGTYSFYEWLFKVDDKYETFIDKKTFLPLKFKRKVHEGGYRFYNEVDFFHEKNEVTSLKGDFKIPDCIHDILSAVFVCRNMNFDNFQEGDTIPITVFLDNEVWPIHARYRGKDVVRTAHGKFNAIKFSPLLIEGTIFESGEDMMVWVSDDENKMPLRVESEILIGKIKVQLRSFEGLRSPINSRLD
jgi:hypothetical protein